MMHKRTPRIGIDARLTYYRQGGISQYIYALIKNLAHLDADTQYIILHSRKDERDLSKAANQRRHVTWTPAHHKLERWALSAETLPLNLDLLHSPDFIPPHGKFQRSVITVHDLTFLHYPHYLTAASRQYYNNQIADAVAHADHILTDSEASRRDILNMLHVPPEKVTAILLGISKHFQPANSENVVQIRRKYAIPADYLLFVGTIEPRKNISGLLKAYDYLRNEISDIPPLVLVGKHGWLTDSIFQTRDDLSLQNHTIWLNDVPFEDLPALYTGAHLLCLPSFYEGFGFPPLEAMACGTPAIVSDRSSLVEIAGDAALLVNPEEPAHIAEGIRRILFNQSLAAKMRSRGLEWVKQFNWQETARQTLQVYRKVLGTHE